MNAANPKYCPAGRRPASIGAQHGFFDFGLALIILAVSGLSVYAVETDSAQNAQAPEQIETASLTPVESD